MPIYEYRCTKCGNEFEAMQKFGDSPLKTCSNCGGPVKKLISRSSFHLKGSGWYLTDYANKSSPKDSQEKTGSSDMSSETSTRPSSPTDSD